MSSSLAAFVRRSFDDRFDRASSRMLSIAVGATLLGAIPAFGVDRYWVGGGTTNDFGFPANWSTVAGGAGGASVPAAADTANFTLASTYDVSFGLNEANARVVVTNGSVGLDLASRTYTLTDANVAIQLGFVSNQTARLTLRGGTLNVTQSASDIAVGSGILAGGAFLTLQDRARITGLADVTIGNFGADGTVSVLDASTINCGRVFVSEGDSSHGVLSLSGIGSSITTINDSYIGDLGEGTMSVSNSAQLNVGTNLYIGNLASSSGTLSVSGRDSSVSVGLSLNVGLNGAGIFNVSDGATVSCGTSLLVGYTGATPGYVSLTGANTRLAIAGTATIGGFGSGNVTISDGATMTSGVSVIGTNGASTGTITIRDAGSNWTASSLTVASLGTGTVNITNGGSLHVAGTLSVNDPAGTAIGTLNIDGGSVYAGSVLAPGVINLHNGLLQVAGGPFNTNTAPYVVDGTNPSDSPVLDLVGSGSIAGPTTLTVGNFNKGTLLVRQNRDFSTGSNAISVGAQPGSDGHVVIDAGALRTTGAFTIGGSGSTAGGNGTVDILNGGTLQAGNFSLLPNGTLNLNNGTLIAQSLSFLSGHLNWTSGTIDVATDAVFNDANIPLLFGTDRTLHAGRTFGALNGSQTFTAGAPFTIDGGLLQAGTFSNVSTVTINAGAIQGFVSAGSSSIHNFASGTISLTGSGTLQSLSNDVLNDGTILLGGAGTTIAANVNVTNNGLIRGTGTISGKLVNGVAGQIQVPANARLVVSGPSHTNAGIISVIGGALQFTGPVTNAASTGLITSRDATLNFTTLANSGSLTFTSGQSDVFGKISQAVGGRITISNGGIANFYDDVTIAPGAAGVQASAIGSTVSRVVFFGSYNGGVSGGGQAFIEGDHRPGNSPALVTFGGDVFYGPFATLHEELGGTTRGTQYDALNVVGIASLAGTLDATILSSFNPAYLATFDVINAGTIAGRFDHFTGQQLSASKYLVQVYSATQLRLTVTLPGDANVDGSVNFDDLLLLAKNYGQTGGKIWQDGDFDNSAGVDFNDLLTLAKFYGQSVTSPGAATIEQPLPASIAADFTLAQSLIPEPTMLAGIAMASLGACRRRRGR